MTLMRCVMKVNGKYFAGECEDSGYKSRTSTLSGVFHDYGSGFVSGLKLVSDPSEARIIEGTINLKSDVDRVMQRVRDGFKLQSIEIINIDNEAMNI